MRRVVAALIAAGLSACGSAEYVPPLKPVEGVPADLPALGPGDYAAIRLIING